jgi:hypothetical protein
MSTATRQKRKLFTVEQANATLPLVRAITSDLVQLARDVIDRRQRLVELTAGRTLEQGDPYADELIQVQEELDGDLRRIQGYVDELVQLGVEPKGASEGLVDFPSVLDGRPIYLCWKLGEREVMYWHELDAGYAGRKLIAKASGAERSTVNAATSCPC